MNEKKLINSCILVKGSERSTIIDIQRKSYFWIENRYVKQLETGLFLDQEFFKFLEDNQLLVDNTKNFLPINLTYESPELLNNILIDFDETSTYSLLDCLKKIAFFNCKHFQIRVFSEINLIYIEEIISFLNNLESCISFELILKFTNEITEEWVKDVVNKNIKIKTILFHSANEDYIFQEYNDITRFEMGNVYYTSQIIDNAHHCGFISNEYFNFKNIQALSESYSRNNCLNQKLSIDKDGEIKNCPAIPCFYGNINNLSKSEIETIVLSKEFQKLWYLSKDKIEVCKDCEFRLICSDCRAHTINGDLLKKPLHCNYNPYEKFDE